MDYGGPELPKLELEFSIKKPKKEKSTIPRKERKRLKGLRCKIKKK